MEFSKKILYVNWITTTIVIFFSFVWMWEFEDLSPLTVIIGGLFTELAAGTGFYYWKAKNENMAKFKNNVKEDEGENY